MSKLKEKYLLYKSKFLEYKTEYKRLRRWSLYNILFLICLIITDIAVMFIPNNTKYLLLIIIGFGLNLGIGFWINKKIKNLSKKYNMNYEDVEKIFNPDGNDEGSEKK